MIETIENDWDALFRDYPEIYDEFANVETKPTGAFRLGDKLLAHNRKQKQGSPTLYPVDQVESVRFADRDRRTSTDLLAQLVPNAQRSQPTVVQVINKYFPLKGKVVLDVGCGTGGPTFKLAEYAGSVIGVEPARSMLAVAAKRADERAIANAKFVDGCAEDVPLPDNSVDIVVAVTLQTLYNEENIQPCLQFTRPCFGSL